MDWTALALTARLALVTTGLLLVLGLPIAAWLAGTRTRWRPLVEAVVALPLVLPPTVIGFYLLVLMGAHGVLGQAWQALTAHSLAFSFEGLVLASVLYTLPFAVQPMTVAFRSVDPRLIEAAWCLGRSKLETFALVTVPLAWPGIATAAVLSFAHTVGEFGVVLMVGGNIPGATRTLSISIYDATQSLDYATAGWTSAALLAFSLVVLTVVNSLQSRLVTWPKS
jgi:molybdate transport system permease protein